MKKTVSIAITGHRDIIVTTELKRDLKSFFKKLKSKNEKVELLSPLADGADRLVADIYLKIFQKESKLIVPMPFNKERYMEDFNNQSKEDFLNYLKVAEDVIEVKNTQGCNYKSVGIYVTDKSDILLALWDGTFNNKSGGTGDIVKYAREKDKEVVHFLCERLSD